MPTIQTFRPITFGARFTSRLAANISTVLRGISEWSELRKTRNELLKLTDLQLNDIGLTRGDVDQITR
jgi:uncharacterized protein YjiS (DUF1127 family)